MQHWVRNSYANGHFKGDIFIWCLEEIKQKPSSRWCNAHSLLRVQDTVWCIADAQYIYRTGNDLSLLWKSTVRRVLYCEARGSTCMQMLLWTQLQCCSLLRDSAARVNVLQPVSPPFYRLVQRGESEQPFVLKYSMNRYKSISCIPCCRLYHHTEIHLLHLCLLPGHVVNRDSQKTSSMVGRRVA